jgi:hypothetical protein
MARDVGATHKSASPRDDVRCLIAAATPARATALTPIKAMPMRLP